MCVHDPVGTPCDTNKGVKWSFDRPQQFRKHRQSTHNTRHVPPYHMSCCMACPKLLSHYERLQSGRHAPHCLAGPRMQLWHVQLPDMGSCPPTTGASHISPFGWHPPNFHYQQHQHGNRYTASFRQQCSVPTSGGQALPTLGRKPEENNSKRQSEHGRRLLHHPWASKRRQG